MSKFAKILRYSLMTKEKNANIKLLFMQTRFLPTHGADAQKKAGWHASNFFSLASILA